MHSRTYKLHRRDQWQFCLTAIAAAIDRLPPLYRIAEHGTDEVALELHVKAGAWEVLRLNGASDDQVAASISPHLVNVPAYPFPDWLISAVNQLEADLQWADTRDCSDQVVEILSALVTFRASMLRGSPF
jgi:hypothetical protein